MKKKQYEAPWMQALYFGAKDIIITSGFAGGEIPLGPTATALLDDIF